MATLKAPKTISRRQELRKDAVTTVWVRIQEVFYGNRGIAWAVAGGIVAIVAGILGWDFLQGARGVQADEALGGIIRTYENGDYQLALDGTATAVGLLEIIDDYGSTPAGNIARFYAADASYRLGDYETALEFFEDYNGGDDLLGASALAGQAAIYELSADFERAADLYVRAAEAVDNSLVSPIYWMSAGLAYEKAGVFEDAETAFRTIKDTYPESEEAKDIDFYLGRVLVRLN